MGTYNKHQEAIAFASRKPLWRENPFLFFEEVLQIKLTHNQKKIVKAVLEHNKIAIKSGNSLGKTYLFAAIVVWFFFCYLSPEDEDTDVIVVFTAPNFEQVSSGIFSNVKKFVLIANKNMKKRFGDQYPFLKDDFSENDNIAKYKYDELSYILGLSTKSANAISGKHADFVLQIFDEAQGLPDQVFSAFTGIAQGGKIIKRILLGNPTISECDLSKEGRHFFDAFNNENSTYHQMTFSSFDTPNFIEMGIKLEDFINDTVYDKIDKFCGTNYNDVLSKKISKSIYENTAKEKLPFGSITNPLDAYNTFLDGARNIDAYDFRTRILGLFPDQNTNTIFPESWIKNSLNNYYLTEYFEPGDKILGIDIGGSDGHDPTGIAFLNGNRIEELGEYTHSRQKELCDLIENKYYELDIDFIKIERDGVGRPYYDELLERKLNVIPIQSGGSAGIPNPYNDPNIKEQNDIAKKIFFGKRDEYWWELRNRLRPDNDHQKPILLPNNPQLLKQMGIGTYKYLNKKIKVVDKETIIKMLSKKSPNLLDSVLIALSPEGDLSHLKAGEISLIQISKPGWQ
jgi:hypothetical protein